MPPNFQNSKIYYIRSHQTDKIYIGSTTQPLSVRFGEHKRKPCTSRQILAFDDAHIELLEEFPCANKMQLNRREGELIRLHDCVNKRLAGRTSAEYRGEHKTEIKEQTKQYCIDNKQTIDKKNKEYNENNKEHLREHAKQKYNCFCGGRYALSHKSEHFKTAKHIEFMKT